MSFASGFWIHKNMVFHQGDPTGSAFFRIPFLLSTSRGTMIAGTDANYGSTGDSAENISAVIRTKCDALNYKPLEGWDDVIIPNCLHMYDYADEFGHQPGSASFIDGVILEDTIKSNRIILLIDAFPWNGGIFSHMDVRPDGLKVGGTRRKVAIGDGFCRIGNKKYLLLSGRNIKDGSLNDNTDRSMFNFAADIYGKKNVAGRYNIYHIDGTPKPYSADGSTVDDSNLSLSSLSKYSLNDDFELYKDDSPLFIRQLSLSGYSGNNVPVKIFYEASPLQMYNTSYIMLVYSEDEGRTWSSGTILTGMIKREDSQYYVTAPGSGVQIKDGKYRGRLIVPVHYQIGDTSYAEVIYSDDGGYNWEHGEPVPNFVGDEAVAVELPGGHLQIFLRNPGAGGRVMTATSIDGGKTWRDLKSALGDDKEGVSCQVSAISYSRKVTSHLDGHKYPAVIMSTAFNRNRTGGRICVGLLKPAGTYTNTDIGYDIFWEYIHEITDNDTLFAYSCLTEMADGRIAVLYESSETSSWADGLKQMYYREYTIEELTK